MRHLVVGLVCLALIAPCASAFSMAGFDFSEKTAANLASGIKNEAAESAQAIEGVSEQVDDEIGLTAAAEEFFEDVKETVHDDAPEEPESEENQGESTAPQEEPGESQSDEGEENENPDIDPVSDAAMIVDGLVGDILGATENVLIFVGDAAKRLFLAAGLIEEHNEAEALIASPQEVMPVVAGASILAAIGAVIGTVLAAISKFAVMPLYGALQHGEIDNENRKRIYDIIKSNPGMCIKDIARESEMGWGTVVYHISRLKRDNMIVISFSGKHRYLFENGGRYRQEERMLMSASKNETTARVIEFIKNNPGTTQKGIGNALRCSSALVSWHVSKLEQAGMVSKERVGKTVEHRFIGPNY